MKAEPENSRQEEAEPYAGFFAEGECFGAYLKEREAKRIEAITEYWSQHYSMGGCAVCGNKGEIRAHARVCPERWMIPCFCPNGQAIRAAKGGR